ncbi:hypothetical protein CCHR01_01408 [Colletotrichum chrysophilum]|uniref:Uncharacterized protein n=1 Tax=Colletotrichum chrysophilum TaxID=1836956 RepID=A0AAD9AWZ0_9PEZI|nr:hypothetical protein CCHR01_01408 [Colletotrichum chrysophilum]
MMIHQHKVDTAEVSPVLVHPPGLSSIDSGPVRTRGFIPHDVTSKEDKESKAPKIRLPTRTHQQQSCPKSSDLQHTRHQKTPGPACSDMLIVCSVSITPQHASLSLSGILRTCIKNLLPSLETIPRTRVLDSRTTMQRTMSAPFLCWQPAK